MKILILFGARQECVCGGGGGGAETQREFLRESTYAFYHALYENVY